MTAKHEEPKHPVKASHHEEPKPAPKAPKPVVNVYQQHVEQEHKELSERLKKLNDFLVVGEFNDLDAEEQAMVHKQQDVMSQYLEILQQRLEHHSKEKPDG